MNILAIIPSYRPEEYFSNIGGGEISNRLLLEGLAEKGHNVTVLTWNTSGFGSGKRGGVTVKDFGKGYQNKCVRLITLGRFKSLARGYFRASPKPDILVCGTEGLGVALDLVRSESVPVGLFVRAMENFDKPKSILDTLVRYTKTALLGKYGASAVASVDFLLPNSMFVENYCFNLLSKKMPSTVVYPPLDWQTYGEFDVTPIRRISMVGTSEKKGVKLVECLARRFPLVEFRVLGSKVNSKNTTGMPMNLKLLGWSDIQKEFACQTDAVLVPSLCEEAFGRVAIEALACGKPPLVSAIGGLPEAVSYESLLCLKPGDEDVWGETVERLIENPEPFVVAAKKAALFLERFSAKQQINKLEFALQAQVNK